MIKIKLNDLPAKRGKIKQIFVEQGSHIKAYDTILIVECEEEDFPVITLLDGYIEKLYVNVDQKVKRGDIVVKMKTQISRDFLNEELEKSDNSFSNWEEINDVSSELNESNNSRLLNADFTKKFEKTELPSQLTSIDNVNVNDIKKEELNSIKETETINLDEKISSSNEIIKEMQEKNSSGISKFRQRILNKVNSLQDNVSNNSKNDNISNVSPLSFREIIMKRVNKIQKAISSEKVYNYNYNSNLQTSIEHNEDNILEKDNVSLAPKLSYSEKLIQKSQELLRNNENVLNERDRIAKKINLIKKGEINKNSNLKDIKDIVNNSDDSWKANDIPLKYRPSKYNKKENKAEQQIIKDSHAQKLAKLVNDVSVTAATSADFISEFAPTSKVNFFNLSSIKEDEVVSSPVKIRKIEKNGNDKPSLVKQNLNSPINYDISYFENGIMIPSEPKYNTDVKKVTLESREKLDNNKYRKNLLNSLRFGKYYALATTLNCEVDMTEIINLRERMIASNKTNSSEMRLNYKVFILKAISLSLEQYPQLNALYDSETNELVIKHYHNIATVIQSSYGMQIPVIHSVNELSITKLDEAIQKSNKRIRDNNVNDNEFSDSTITVSDFGAFGAISGTSLLHHPNVAIINIGKIIKKPVVWGRNIAIRHMMYVSVTFDQRVVDFNLAGHFLEDLKNNLEKPYVLSLS